MAHEARYANYIGGRRVAPASGLYLKDANPADALDIIGEFPNSGSADASHALEAAKSAFPAWASLAPEARGEFLRRAASILEQRAVEVARDLVREQGKPARYAKAEVLAAAAILRHSAALASFASGHVLPQSEGAAFALMQRSPVGPCVIISSWLDPLAGPLREVAPALALGNTVTLTPSEWTPQAAWNLLQCLEEAGLPAGVFNVVFGEPSMAGRFLAAHGHAAAIAFEGSLRVASAMVQWCSAPFRRMRLETHGWSALILTEAGNCERAAADAAQGAFVCAGQRPRKVALALAHKSKYREFVERAAGAAGAAVLGSGEGADADVGPLIGPEARSRVMTWLKKCQASGFELVAGGAPPLDERFGRGSFLMPAVLAAREPAQVDLPQDVLGPVLVVAPFRNTDEALTLLGALEGCQAACVYSGDVDDALRLAMSLSLPAVAVNRLPGAQSSEEVLSYCWEADPVAAYTRVKTISVGAPQRRCGD